MTHTNPTERFAMLTFTRDRSGRVTLAMPIEQLVTVTGNWLRQLVEDHNAMIGVLEDVAMDGEPRTRRLAREILKRFRGPR